MLTLEVNEQLYCPIRCVEEILEAYSMGNDDFGGGTIPSDLRIDTTNSKEIMADRHIKDNIYLSSKDLFNLSY